MRVPLWLFIVLSGIAHLALFSLFYIKPLSFAQGVPRLTRVSFLNLDLPSLQDEQDAPSWKQDDPKVQPGREPDIDFQPDRARSYFDLPEQDPVLDFELSEHSAEQIEQNKQQDVQVNLSSQRKLVRMYYPKYPLWAKRLGLQADIELRFEIDRLGQVRGVVFERMSGHPELDVLALRAVRRWKFERLPGQGQEKQWGDVKLKFRVASA